MAFNLFDTVRSYLNNDLISKAAIYLGEAEPTLRKGLNAVIPVSLAGIVQKAESSPESLLNLAKEAGNSDILSNLSSSFKVGGQGVPSIGPSAISNIFGDKFGSIANAISNFTGLKGSTSSSLMGTILPLALGVLGRHAGDSNLSPGALSSLLSSQKSSILSSLPGGLNISRLLGLGGTEVRGVSAMPEVEIKRKSWLLPVLLGLLGVILLIWLLSAKTCNKAAVTPVSLEDTATVKQPETVSLSAETLKLKLPNGVELDAYKGGIEDQLLAFLKDPAAQPGKDNWFDFRRLNFEFGTANILPESRGEVDNIVKILQAFPSVKIKLGGYTDKVGDEAGNLKLSQDRANAVAEALKIAGVGSQVTGAEGYGSQFAKFPASAPEEDRVKDRHVSVSVRNK